MGEFETTRSTDVNNLTSCLIVLEDESLVEYGILLKDAYMTSLWPEVQRSLESCVVRGQRSLEEIQ